MSEKEYIVSLEKGVDYDQFWSEMESSTNGLTFVPDRTVDIVDNRDGSTRNCHYSLTKEEAELLKQDPRVLDVDVPVYHKDFVKKTPWYTEQTGNFTKPSTQADSNNSFLNWGLIRHSNLTNVYGSGKTTDLKYLYELDGTGVDVVIHDTGLQIDHPEFQDANGVSRVKQIDWYAESGLSGYQSPYHYRDFNGHGTHVGGTIAGKTYGWAKNSNIYLVKVRGLEGTGDEGTGIPDNYFFDVIKLWHRNKPIDPRTGQKRPTVVNMSWGYSAPYYAVYSGSYRGVPWVSSVADINKGMNASRNSSYRVPSIDVDLQELIDEGVIVCIAAGNNSHKIDIPGGVDYDNYWYSSWYQETIYYHRGCSPNSEDAFIVGSLSVTPKTDELDKRVWFSNGGPGVTVYTAGNYIMSSTSTINEIGGSYTTAPYYADSNFKQSNLSGTSMASPNMAGIAALYLQQDPSLTPYELIQKVKLNATSDAMYSTGLDNDYGNTESVWGGNTLVAYINTLNGQSLLGESGLLYPIYEPNRRRYRDGGLIYPRIGSTQYNDELGISIPSEAWYGNLELTSREKNANGGVVFSVKGQIRFANNQPWTISVTDVDSNLMASISGNTTNYYNNIVYSNTFSVFSYDKSPYAVTLTATGISKTIGGSFLEIILDQPTYGNLTLVEDIRTDGYYVSFTGQFENSLNDNYTIELKDNSNTLIQRSTGTTSNYIGQIVSTNPIKINYLGNSHTANFTSSINSTVGNTSLTVNVPTPLYGNVYAWPNDLVNDGMEVTVYGEIKYSLGDWTLNTYDNTGTLIKTDTGTLSNFRGQNVSSSFIANNSNSPYTTHLTLSNGQRTIGNTSVIVNAGVPGVMYYGQTEFTTPGTYTWTCPSEVESVCVVAVGGGGCGELQGINPSFGASGGGGAGLGWKNNIPVTPGQTYTVVVGSGGNNPSDDGQDSYFIDTATVKGGKGYGGSFGAPTYMKKGYGGDYVGDGGGNGGNGSAPAYISYLGWRGAGGAGGAGGYTGKGGNAGSNYLVGPGNIKPEDGQGGSGSGGNGWSLYPGAGNAGMGGGVGIYGEGNSGIIQITGQGGNQWGVSGSIFENKPNYGAGSGGGLVTQPYKGTNGVVSHMSYGNVKYTIENTTMNGAVRIIWGKNRAFPSTLTKDIT